jgi:spermidine synthase
LPETPRWNWYVEWEFPGSGHLFHKRQVLCECQSRYQSVEVAVLDVIGKALILDGKIQSSALDEHVYHEALVHPPMILHGSPRRVLILGGGEGATAREVLRFRSVEEAVMVDIDEVVIKAAREYLPEWHQGSFDDPRLKLIIGDGLKYVEEASEAGERFDVIIADLADPTEGGPAYKLYVREFYEKVKSILAPGGVFVTQATSLSYDITTHAVIRNTLASVFRHTASYSVFIKSFDDEWSFILASDEKNPAALTRERVEGAIREMVRGENRFYDWESHLRMFNLPRYARDILAREKRVATLENPVYLPL